jgi:hypothetical protein
VTDTNGSKVKIYSNTEEVMNETFDVVAIDLESNLKLLGAE